MTEKLLSLAEFHKDHKTIYNVQSLIDNATHIYNKFQTPEAIVNFYNNYDLDQVPEIKKSNLSGGSFYEVCGMAYHYAKYVTGSTERHIVKPKHIITVPKQRTRE